MKQFFILYSVVIVLFTGCNEQLDEDKNIETIAKQDSSTLTPLDQFMLSCAQRSNDAVAFNFPVGKPDGKGYYNAQGFGKNNHLGDDWNGTGGGNSDQGDPVFSVANGFVNTAQDLGGGWGNVVRIYHCVDNNIIESIYAHLDEIFVQEGDLITIGDTLGTIGTANGAYLAHLHFEIRDNPTMDIGPGYSEITDGYLNPTKFINTHRGN